MSRPRRLVDRIAGGGWRSALAGVLLAGAMVAVLVVGQRIANGSYHRAAVAEVARIEPASRLLTDMLNAQASAEGYVTTIDPFRLIAYQGSLAAFAADVERAIRASGDAPSVQAELRRLDLLANAWRRGVGRALQSASIGHTVAALRVLDGALNPFIRDHARLMATLQSRRLDAVHDADRWSAVVLGVSIAAVVLGCLALALVAGRRPARGPLRVGG